MVNIFALYAVYLHDVVIMILHYILLFLTLSNIYPSRSLCLYSFIEARQEVNLAFLCLSWFITLCDCQIF